MSVADNSLKWIVKAALPLWVTRGYEPSGSWVEYLDEDAQPVTNAVRRMRVTARQIYTYALATELGWCQGGDIVARGFEYLQSYGRHQNGGGYVHLLNPDHTPYNSKRDLYDHAFCLLAFASAYKIDPQDHFKQAAHTTLDFLNSELSSQDGGWFESLPDTRPRRQNPHMHLFEAFMAWMQVDDDPIWRSQADHVYELFTRFFYDEHHRAVREFFTSDWSIDPTEKGKIVEPGHGAEWVWLLYLYERMVGISTAKYANALYARVTATSKMFQINAETIMGEPVGADKRLWVQTEMIKAHIAQAERYLVDGKYGKARHLFDQACITLQSFMMAYLRPDGTWIDELNADGDVISNTIPTSSFYHIACMIAEVNRVSQLFSALD